MNRTLAGMATALALCASAHSVNADSQPFTFTHTVDFDGLELKIPVEVWMTALNDNQIGLKVAGNLSAIQRNLPRIFADVVQDDCDRRIAFQVDEGYPEGDNIRMTGRVQVQIFSCSDPDDFDTRARIISNVIDVSALISGGVKNNCVEGKLEELTLDPSGLIGGVLNLIGLTKTISTLVRDDVNRLLNEDDNCFDLPDVLKMLDSKIVSGGFRDFGNNTIGTVVKGRIDIRAPAVIALLNMFNEEGLLSD